MRFFITIALLMLASNPSGASAWQDPGREVVATVDSRPVYLDEIKLSGSPERQQGEIKFVDPDGSPDEPGLESEIALLRQRIKLEIISEEAARRNLSASPTEISRELDALAQKQWELLMPTEKDRKEFLTKMRNTSLKILEGIDIWKQDKSRGDEFAKKELAPLGMNDAAWQYYTRNADDPELLSRLGRWRNIDDMPEEELRNFVFGAGDPSQVELVESVIAAEKLKESVTSGVSADSDEAERLYDLTENTEWIEIVIIPESADVYKSLLDGGAVTDKDLPAELLSKSVRLPRTSMDRKTEGAVSNEYMLLSVYAPALAKGALSKQISMRDKNGVRGNVLIYIKDIKVSSATSEPGEETIKKLSGALTSFKKDREFNDWLNEQMPLRARIMIPAYRKALD